MKIEELIASYSHLNSIYTDNSGVTFGLQQMREINSFYSCYSDLVAMEQAVLMQIGTEKTSILLRQLHQEASDNLMYYSRIGNSIDIIADKSANSVFELLSIKEDIEEQKQIISEIYDKLKDVNHKLDWPVNYTEIEIRELEKDYDKLNSLHKSEQTKLSNLYAQKNELDKSVISFVSSFHAIKKLDEDVIQLADKYLLRHSKDEEHINSTPTTEREIITPPPTNQKSKPNNPNGRKVEPFTTLLIGSDLRKEKTMERLHELANGRSGKKLALVITCAIESGLINRPTFVQIRDEFAKNGSYIGSENSIIPQIGKTRYSSSEYEGMMENFKDLKML